MKNNSATKNLVYSAVFVCLTAIIAQIAIPTPFGVPFTLQTLIVALAGLFLGIKWGTVYILVYVFAGAIGLPFFSSFTGGFGAILSTTGGFIIGFIPLCVFCALTTVIDNKALKVVFFILAVILLHLIGALTFSLVTKNEFFYSLLVVSLPFILKDAVCIFLAILLSQSLNKRLNK